jgi:uncharacterized repeat protein (TIGR01451 family)
MATDNTPRAAIGRGNGWNLLRSLFKHLLTWLLCATCAAGALAWSQQSQTSIARSARYTGRINFVTTGGSLRSQSNTGDACALASTSTRALSGVPPGTTVLAAYLYWGGSASTTAGGATQVDATVTLNGNSVSATRTFTAAFDNGGTLYRYFGGVADVTSRVTGNGNYTFGGLAVNNGAPHCAAQAVTSGWALVVIYQGTNERLRAINVFDGLQFFRGNALTLVPDGFRTPPTSIDGRIAVVTWEGDPGNSDPLNGYSESLTFNGAALDDGLVPAGSVPTVQQFDGTINSQGVTTSYGADVDTYDVTSQLAPGQEYATTIYSAGGDLVLLAAQVVSVTTEPKVDLAITKTAAGAFVVGAGSTYLLHVGNVAGAGVEREDNAIVVTDALPAGLGFVSASGAGWACGAVGPVVTCTHAPILDPGASLPDITLNVSIAPAAAPAATNTATVTSSSLDGNSANNSATLVTPVASIQPALRVQKTSEILADDVNGASNPKRIPGSIVRYTIEITNSGAGSVDASGLVITDTVPAGTALFVSGGGGPPIEFLDGTPASGLAYAYASSVTFSNQPGGVAPFVYVPAPDAHGVDNAVTALRIAPSGSLLPASGGGNPSFRLRFRVRVR